MRLSFDLTSDTQSKEVTLPGQTALLFAPSQLITAKECQFSFKWEDDLLSGVSLVAQIGPEDYRRLAKTGVAGISDASGLEDHLLMEVDFALEEEILNKYKENLSESGDPHQLLRIFDTESDYPLFLNLNHFQALRAVQVTQIIEDV